MARLAVATEKSYAQISIESNPAEEADETTADPCDFITATSLPTGLRLRITKDETLSEEGRELVKDGVLEIA